MSHLEHCRCCDRWAPKLAAAEAERDEARERLAMYEHSVFGRVVQDNVELRAKLARVAAVAESFGYQPLRRALLEPDT